jgi:hypothetical protein
MKLTISSALLGCTLTLAAWAQNSPESKPSPAPTQSPTTPASQAAQQMHFTPGTLLPVEVTKSVDAKKAKQGDPVLAKTAIDLLSQGKIVVPKGAKVFGHVTDAKPHEKGSESSLGIAFDKLVTSDGKEIPFNASIQSISVPQAPAVGNETGGAPSYGTAGGTMPGATAGGRMGGSPAEGQAGTYPGAAGGAGYPTGNSGSSPNASAQTHGLSGVSLKQGEAGQGSTLTSQNKNVKLESGTELTLRVQ